MSVSLPLAPSEDPGLAALVDLAIAGTRARSGPPLCERDILPEDLARLRGSPRAALQHGPLQRIRHSHHLAAREIASGKPIVEVSLITGYTPQRLGDLQGDPAFCELVAHYKGQVDGKWLNVVERMESLGVAVTEEIQHRLEEAPEEISTSELRELAKTFLDRAGHGPQSTRNVNVRSQNQTLLLIDQIKREAEASPEATLVRQISSD